MQYQTEQAQRTREPHRESTSQDLPDAASTFRAISPHLFRIAYRRVRSIREAEDIVQETWIRWQTCDRSGIRDSQAFLTTATDRLAINAGTSARARHETCVTSIPDLPDSGTSPELAAEREDQVLSALRLILEKLTPVERAVFLLREAFDYPYEEIAGLLQRTQGSIRQHVRRARKHLTNRSRTTVSAAEQRRLVEAFQAATHTGDMNALEQLLAAGALGSQERDSREHLHHFPAGRYQGPPQSR
jgi:RNA polymerase sigma factor (sigma-70 family)